MMRWINCSRVMKGLISNTFRCLPFVLFGLPVLADVPAYPPQNVPSMHTLATAGNGQVISGRVNGVGYSWDTNGTTIKVDRFQNVNRGAGGLVGTKTNPVNLYDNYGNVARGQIQTQTAMPQTSTMAKAAAALYGAQVFGSAAKHQAPNVGQAIANGDYKGAAQYAVEGLLQGLKETGDAVLFGGIGGVESGFQAYKDAQQAKAQQAFDKAEQDSKYWLQQYDPSLKTVSVWYMNNIQTGQRSVFLITGKYFSCCAGVSRNGEGMVIGSYLFADNGERYIVPPYKYDEWTPKSEIVENRKELYERRPTVEDVMLSQAEIQAIMAKQLEQMLNDNNRNHTELMNALWQAGVIGPGNTQTMVSGSPADNTFLTQPYTPEGATQAQQTQFIINNNGTVTQNIVKRPDLAANTSQAPTRAEVGNQQQQNQQDTRQQKDGSTAEKPDICAQNPNSLMCAPMGNTDYQDLVLPQQNINIALSPLHIFNTDAACPAPTSFSIAGTQQRMSYEPMCDTARKARPFIIMMAMTAAFLMVFSALNRR